MATRRLIDLPIRHIEHVFSPAGLPLPAKGETEIGTTSILVRGGAGTGKTTLALGLAYAIAKAGEGLVLYLTTEFSPVEIAFKATLIGLEEKIVDVWPGSEGIQSGGVIVESLSYLRQGNPVMSSAERKSSVIDEVWKLLHPEKPTADKTPLPIRSVVIDALTLPDPGENEGTLRADVVAFVQALENEGISVVLVEELGIGASAWSSFVVDVVFELSFQPDSETQDLRRKLTVSKCRYAVSIPGPHNYGLDNGEPAVWPDLFRVLTIDTKTDAMLIHRVIAPQLMLPTKKENTWASLRASIILSPYTTTSAKCMRTLRRLPGARWINVDCGVQTRVEFGDILYSTTEEEGVHAIGWGINAISLETGANAIRFQGIESLLSHSGSVAHTMRLLEALRLMGYMVCIHSPSAGTVGRILSLVDYNWSEGKHRPQKRDTRRNRSIARFLAICDRTTPKVSTLNSSPLTPIVPISRNAWNEFFEGREWHAARATRAAIESKKPDPSMLLLWKCICAAIAKNEAAIDELKALIGKTDELRILDPLLRGLVGTKQIDEADRIITDVAARNNLAPWMTERLRADARIDSDDKSVLDDAIKRLTALLSDEFLPPEEKAETKFNLAMAIERAGSTNQAIETLEQLLAANPEYEPANVELERLRNPSKPS